MGLAVVKADSFWACGVPLIVILTSGDCQFANRAIPEVSSLLNPQSALHNQISTVALETARASDERAVPDSAQSEHMSLLPLVGITATDSCPVLVQAVFPGSSGLTH